MKSKNIAYSKEYQEHRKTFDYIYQDKFMTEEERILLADGKHELHISFYNDESFEFSKYRIHTSRTEVFDKNGNKVSEFKNINHDVNFYSIVEHTNGKSYLIFSIDLYGYSIMNLENYDVYHFIPEESFKGNEETFIWTDVYYCNENNIIAVDGCYWACPFSTEFFDFSTPEDLPYEKILSSYDMEDELNIDTDVIPVRWNEDGLIVLKCCIDSEGDFGVEKVVDVIALANVKRKC